MQDAKTAAVETLLEEKDGQLLVVLSTIDRVTADPEGMPEVEEGNGLLSWMFNGTQQVFAKYKALHEHNGTGGTIAVTTNGIVLFVNDHQRIPRKRIAAFPGYDKIGSRSNADLLILELNSVMIDVQPSQLQDLAQILKIAKANT